MRTSLVALAFLVAPWSVSARTIEPGSIWLSAGLGGGIKMGSPLGGSGGHLLLMAQGEYAISRALGAVGGLHLGLAGTKPLRLRGGVRYRLIDLGLPVSPWGQIQLSVGRVFNVIGANLTTIGVAVSAGADYFLTADIGVGGMLALDMSSTLGARPAFYGTFEFLVVASYAW